MDLTRLHNGGDQAQAPAAAPVGRVGSSGDLILLMAAA
jgi:hypothetical protein